MKGRSVILLALAALLCCSCGGGFKDIKVVSCDVKSLIPTGFSKMEALLKVGIHNPTTEIHLSDIVGTVKYDDEPCLTLTVPDTVIEGKSDRVYMVTVTGQIERSFDLLKIISVVRDTSAIDAATLDIQCHAALSSGIGKDIVKRDIPLKELIGRL